MKDMKLIMEDWRYQTGKTDFKILCEHFDKGLITEEILFERWHRRMLFETDELLNELLNEGMMDALRTGYEQGKKLAGKAKELFLAAAKKVNDFFQDLCLQIMSLILRAKTALKKIADSLQSIFDKVQKFCSAHPTICTIIKVILLLLVVAAVVWFVRNVLLQTGAPDLSICEICVTKTAEGDVVTLSRSGVDAMQGLVSDVATSARGDKISPEFQQNLVDAHSYLQQCSNSTDLQQLADAGEKVSPILQAASSTVEKMVTEQPESVLRWQQLASKIVIQTRTGLGEVVDAAGNIDFDRKIRWQQIALPN